MDDGIAEDPASKTPRWAMDGRRNRRRPSAVWPATKTMTHTVGVVVAYMLM